MDNLLTGDIPNIPSGVMYIGLARIHFTGKLSLNVPRRIYIDDNWITEIFVQDIRQIESRHCIFSNNPLLGHPSLILLSMCTQICIYMRLCCHLHYLRA